jgi:predicted alpha/beta hydrolase family esterase
MIKTLLIPGLDGSPTPHWQHWWAAIDPTAKIV